MEGIRVGPADGFNVEGQYVGIRLGLYVGTLEGLRVLGFNVGPSLLGSAVGKIDGEFVGFGVVGFGVGFAVGMLVGPGVGNRVGARVDIGGITGLFAGTLFAETFVKLPEEQPFVWYCTFTATADVSPLAGFATLN